MHRITAFARGFTRPVLIASALLLLCSCDTTKLTNRREWECLNSEKLNFNDPTSVKFVANLGTRGEGGDYFWVRYMAKNSFGAYRQANMKCWNLLHDRWEEDRIEEKFAIDAVKDKLKERDRKQMLAEYKKMGRGDPYDLSPYSDESYQRQAEEVVYEGTSDLPTADYMRQIHEYADQHKGEGAAATPK